MTSDQENAYVRGTTMAWLQILQIVMHNLNRDSDEFTIARLIAEREEAVLVLRRLCDDVGDNDWPGNLHLADIIEKHLARYITGS